MVVAVAAAAAVVVVIVVIAGPSTVVVVIQTRGVGGAVAVYCTDFFFKSHLILVQ